MGSSRTSPLRRPARISVTVESKMGPGFWRLKMIELLIHQGGWRCPVDERCPPSDTQQVQTSALEALASVWASPAFWQGFAALTAAVYQANAALTSHSSEMWGLAQLFLSTPGSDQLQYLTRGVSGELSKGHLRQQSLPLNGASRGSRGQSSIHGEGSTPPPQEKYLE